MALLTTSQLTFYDLKDAYHVEINPDCIVINCDEKGISKEKTEIDISYGIYCGSTRVSGTAEIINFEINDSQISWISTECSSTDDGHIKFEIPKDINLTSIDSVHIKFEEQNTGDAETFTFDKYIQLIKVTDGASGTGMVFKIYSEDGTAFREDMSEILLETVVLVGERRVDKSEITSYKWQWRDGESVDWVDIVEADSDTLIVGKDANWAFKTIRCVINYNGNDYEDYISLTDDVVIYSSEIKYFNGSNVFGTKDKYLIAYMALYKNGKEIDLLPTNQYAQATSVDDSGVIITTVVGTFESGDLLYFVVQDEIYVNKYNIILGQYDGANWNFVHPSQEYVYQCFKATNNLAKAYSAADKIMVISKEEINKTLSISFNAYKQTDNSLVSTANGNIIDTNDPIISAAEPDNAVSGMLWVDISSTPYVLKVCEVDEDGNIKWVNSAQKIGGVLYTSRPSSYSINDVWILNDDEMCFYSVEGTESIPGYTPLTYIESSGTQYINTGFLADNNSKIVMDFQHTNAPTGNEALFGTRKQDTNQLWVCYRYQSLAYMIRRASVTSSNYLIKVDETKRHTIVVNRNSMSIDGCDPVVIPADDLTTLYPVFLFDVNNAGSPQYPAYIKVYSCQIYDNDILVRDFIPCMRNSDNVCGLYDKVNNVFYENSGTGNFIAGDSTVSYYEYGPGSMLRASMSRTENEGFVASDWIEIQSEITQMRDNVAQYFEFNSETGLKIGQKDQKFYVNISATEMGFYDNSNQDDPNKKVVSIGNQSATIKNATIEDSATFKCQTDFNKQINMYNPYKTNKTGFTWQIESDGSLSLVVIKTGD